MSGQVQTDQVEAQVDQVEQEYRREEKRERKAMDSKILAPNFNTKVVCSGLLQSNRRREALGGVWSVR